MLLSPNKSGAWLPNATHRQIPETEVGEERKRSLLKCCAVWANRRSPISRLIYSTKYKQKWFPKRPKPKIIPEFLLHPHLLEPEVAKQEALWLQTPFWGPCVLLELPLTMQLPGPAGSANAPASTSGPRGGSKRAGPSLPLA